MKTDEIARRLAPVLRRGLGAPAVVRELVPLTGGAAKRTYALKADIGGHEQRLILQLASQPSELVARLTPRLTPEQDAELMQAAVAAGVDAPVVRAVLRPEDGLGGGFVTDYVEAEALGRRIVHDEAFALARTRLTAQCGRNLARIHRIPAANHPWLRAYPAEAQIEAYDQQVQHYRMRTPEMAYALAWARRHVPRQRPMRVLHGDFRMGNLLTDREGLKLVLDWEVAHLGDPMQDLGFLCMRTWRFGGAKPAAGVGTRDELFGAYEAAGGLPVDREAAFFWEAFGNLKWAVMAMRKGLRHAMDGGPPATLE
ncbi:MAG: phosphotransferase family protein, partial [Acidobacteria bacterium]|nr:phosphotransferase family protein [Acidobacteriota bacterium]